MSGEALNYLKDSFYILIINIIWSHNLNIDYCLLIKFYNVWYTIHYLGKINHNNSIKNNIF